MLLGLSDSIGALLIAAVVSVLVALIKATKEIVGAQLNLKKISKGIHEVHLATNSMHLDLVEAAKQLGIQIGIDEERLRQGLPPDPEAREQLEQTLREKAEERQEKTSPDP